MLEGVLKGVAIVSVSELRSRFNPWYVGGGERMGADPVGDSGVSIFGMLEVLKGLSAAFITKTSLCFNPWYVGGVKSRNSLIN